ncbi:MAG TPA: phosphate signaling complex protein PhoU [Candidatus Eisenbacteria bacterium]|nr:phosphate signaling complex protein PhoU [Candidatus Eisenbacteria bacterium]
MERHFDEELKDLKQRLLRMADVAQEMIGLAVRCLVEREPARAEDVFRLEETVNRSEVEIEDSVLKLLALRQPIARDLRLLTAILKINNDLERVADQACNISETALYLLKEPPLKPLIDIPHMAGLAQKMIKNSLEAFVNQDAALAKEVCLDDDAVDRINDQVFRELLTYMMQDPKAVQRAVDLILISRNLERIADHATNISEDVIFIVQGKNVKHHLDEETGPPAH